MHYTHVFFDCDSTLLTVETLDLLAEQKGVGEQVRSLTEQSMNGNIPIEEVMPLKMDLIAPHQDEIDRLFEDLCELITPGVQEVLHELRRRGIHVYMLTNNFHQVIKPVADYLGFTDDRILAGHMFQEEGAYAGIDRAHPLGRDGGKPHVLLELMTSTEEGRCIHVGDSVSDLACQGVADLFIGFGGVVKRERVEREAEVFIHDLRDVLEHI